MKLGVPRETRRGEARVAVTPETTATYVEMGFTVLVERGAGEAATYHDVAYEEAGAQLVDADAIWSTCDLILKVATPTGKEVRALREGATLACLFDGTHEDPLVARLASRKATFLALDAVPRITRAQSMDIRSSMANLAGYRAVIEAASHYGRTLGPQVTAAGSTPPAQVLVIGAGVAGLAAIAAARGLGAVVKAFDTRPACKEQVESLGASCLLVELEESGDGKGGYAKVMSQAFIDAEMALFREQAPKTDIVITTAAIPGREAPKLWMADMVEAMPDGGVVVDLAAARGGNCELTESGKVVRKHDITLVGITDLTQSMTDHASRLMARNVRTLVQEIGTAEGWNLDLDNTVIRGVTVLEQGEVRWPAPPPEPSPTPVKKEAPPAPKASTAAAPKKPKPPARPPSRIWMVLTFVGVLLLLALARWAPPELLHHITVFVLACVIGWQVVWNVSPALHTPLMSVTNAISGIILVGGVLQLASSSQGAAMLGFLALLFASINVFGGFAVTQRMLDMFRREA